MDTHDTEVSIKNLQREKLGRYTIAEDNVTLPNAANPKATQRCFSFDGWGKLIRWKTKDPPTRAWTAVRIKRSMVLPSANLVESFNGPVY